MCFCVLQTQKTAFHNLHQKKNQKKKEGRKEEKKNAADDLTTINCIKLDIKLEPSKTEIY